MPKDGTTETNQEIYDLIIVGGGPGGLTAGIYAKRAALKTVLIEAGAPGGQVNQTDKVENYPGFPEISGYELAQKFTEHAQSCELEIVRQEVTAIEPGLEFHTVRLHDNSVLYAHAVIIGTGGRPRRLGVPGENENYGKGVSYCGVCDGFFFRDKTIVVVGGGDTACEEALYLAKLAKQVYLVHRRDEFRASNILVERIKRECNIFVIFNNVVTGIKADNSGVTAVLLEHTQDGEQDELRTDGVFVFIGFEPNNQLIPRGVRKTRNGFVRTDIHCAASLPGIYVIGDLRDKPAKQIVTAAADGCTASLAAAHYVESKKAEKVCKE